MTYFTKHIREFTAIMLIVFPLFIQSQVYNQKHDNSFVIYRTERFPNIPGDDYIIIDFNRHFVIHYWTCDHVYYTGPISKNINSESYTFKPQYCVKIIDGNMESIILPEIDYTNLEKYNDEQLDSINVMTIPQTLVIRGDTCFDVTDYNPVYESCGLPRREHISPVLYFKVAK